MRGNDTLNRNSLTKWQAAYIESAYRELDSGVTGQRLAALGVDVKGKSILDVGCGPGNFLVAASEHRPQRVIGLEPDLQFLKAAQQEINRRTEEGPALIAGTALHLPFRDQTFDLLTCFLVLPHVEDDNAALKEFARVLKVGGTLAISGHGAGFPLRYASRLRLKPLLMYVWTLVYVLTGRKIVQNTLQRHRIISANLTRLGFAVEPVVFARKRLGFVETFRLKAVKQIHQT